MSDYIKMLMNSIQEKRKVVFLEKNQCDQPIKLGARHELQKTQRRF